ncbi:MAG: hypothetical protein IJZ44_02135 [Lachnospiraceae bacterium]|nr:hypothetical protein [Lachnospiraceae bacterium]
MGVRAKIQPWNKPRSTPAREIAGVYIDGGRAREYNRAFNVCGMSVGWEWIEQGAAVYDGRAFPTGFSKDEEFCRQCAVIYEQETRKLTEYNRNKGLDIEGKPLQTIYSEGDKKTMRHDNFGEYIVDLKKIQRVAAMERAEIKQRYDDAEKAWRQSEGNPNVSEYDQVMAKAAWYQSKEIYRSGIEELRKRTDEKIKGIREEFQAHIDDFYSADGSRIDEGLVKLLNSGIKLKSGEIDRLVSQNMNNPTALRLISDYCKEKKVENQSARIYGFQAESAGKEETEIFNAVVAMINRVTGNEEVPAKVWGMGSDYFERFSNDYIKNIANMPVKPESEARE